MEGNKWNKKSGVSKTGLGPPPRNIETPTASEESPMIQRGKTMVVKNSFKPLYSKKVRSNKIWKNIERIFCKYDKNGDEKLTQLEIY